MRKILFTLVSRAKLRSWRGADPDLILTYLSEYFMISRVKDKLLDKISS